MATTISLESYEEAEENHEGFCTACREFTRGECEPDATKYPCPDCGGRTVYGAQEARLRGLVVIGGADDFPDDDEACQAARDALRWLRP